ncbi:uncharacterized protein LOC128737871 isoform X2 [Sabethes cyaneus]|uniref:uncharacterized protein LOC128737871 isoform X2 n=1 Tax=Sabethes cyaneus TaxID=53552 RepID=UPI00237DDFB5|nr:uncharacterized protein LOC128737871 isoform X2 [Sabethes cyaneus]
MVFTNNNSSYLPLDSDQRPTFYKNENLLFPPLPPSSVASVACRRSNNSLIMPSVVTAAAVENHTSSSPMVHHSSNGYYGYVPVNSIPKVMSTGTAATTISGTIIGSADGMSIQLGCSSFATAPVNDDTMMDCIDDSEMENYHQQSHLQRKRKEHLEEAEISCKRRKTWLEQQPQQHSSEGFAYGSNCNQQQMPTYQMESVQPQPHLVSQSAPANGVFANGFTHPPTTTTLTPTTILQEKSKYSETSRCMMSHMI